jgi:hypothetical protein
MKKKKKKNNKKKKKGERGKGEEKKATGLPD